MTPMRIRCAIRHICLAALLGGCASGLPVGPDVVVPGGRFQAVQGEADLVVRSFLIDQGGARREVGGASCAVATSLYSARLRTPARLIVPNFGAQSPELAVSCEAGALRGATRQRILTRWRDGYGYPGRYGYPGGPFGGGYVRLGYGREAYGAGGYGWGGYGWGGYAPTFAVSDYPDIGVVLR